MPANETADAMREMAEKAVGLGSKTGMALDYSEQSILALDKHLGQLHEFLKSPQSKWTENGKWSYAMVYGAYVGEVIRRAAGGEWIAGTLASKPKLLVGNVEMSPPTKVLKRMENGIEDHLPHYVETVLRTIIPAAAKGDKPGRIMVDLTEEAGEERRSPDKKQSRRQTFAGAIITFSVPVGALVGWKIHNVHGVLIGIGIGLLIPVLTILVAGVYLVIRGRGTHDAI